MGGYFLSIRGFAALLGILLAAATASGCGGGSDSDEVTVKAGPLSKAAFVRRADALCVAGRSQFNREYTAFIKKHPPNEKEWVEEVVDKFVLPVYGKLVNQIAAIGAPKGDEQEVGKFLTTLQRRLDSMESEPKEIESSSTPFKPAEKLAQSYGLKGCSESFG